MMRKSLLRSINGAYKATNVKVLGSGTGMIPPDFYLIQVVMRARYASSDGEVMRLAVTRIMRKTILFIS